MVLRLKMQQKYDEDLFVQEYFDRLMRYVCRFSNWAERGGRWFVVGQLPIGPMQ